MSIKKIEEVLYSLSIDDDINSELNNIGFETTFDNSDIEYDYEIDSEDLYFNHTFETNEIKDKSNIFTITISGEAKKIMSYDRWCGTDCIVVKDFEVFKKNV